MHPSLSSQTHRRFLVKLFGADVFTQIPIIDAKKSIRIQPNFADIDGAKPDDATNCVFARCVKRMWGANTVAFFRGIAYVQLLDNKGRPRIERFCISRHGQKMIRQFDEGGPRAVSAAGFELKPPPPSMTLDARKSEKKKSRSAVIKGVKRKVTGNYKGRGNNIAAANFGRIASLRDGRGLVSIMLEPIDPPSSKR